jgi:hypothetical protein
MYSETPSEAVGVCSPKNCLLLLSFRAFHHTLPGSLSVINRICLEDLNVSYYATKKLQTIMGVGSSGGPLSPFCQLNTTREG